MGSSCIYPRDAKQPIKEKYLLSGLLEKTNEPYAIAKIAGIKMCESYNFQYKTNYKCLMPTNTFGPNDNYDHLNSHFFPSLIKKIHSVDSLEIAQRINHIASDLGLFPKVLLQVNNTNESSKHGFSPSDLVGSLDDLLELDRIEIEGLMSIPPFDPDPENVRPNFIFLRNFRDQLESDTGVSLPQLSMGMSNDYEIAIEEGATAVRVGSSIFGKRKYFKKNES